MEFKHLRLRILKSLAWSSGILGLEFRIPAFGNQGSGAQEFWNPGMEFGEPWPAILRSCAAAFGVLGLQEREGREGERKRGTTEERKDENAIEAESEKRKIDT